MKVEKQIARMQLDWARLGPVYLAALFWDYSLTSDVLIAAFPLMLGGNQWYHGASAAMDILKDRRPTEENHQACAEFMTCRIADIVDQAVEGILLFNTYVKRTLQSESDHSSIAAIQSGQLAILQKVLQISGMQYADKPLKFAKQWVRNQALSIGPIMNWVEEAVGRFLRSARDDWRGPKLDLFTDNFLTLVLINDEGALFAEYLGALDRQAVHAVDSVLALVETAVDLDAGSVVDTARSWCGGLHEDTLSRAVAAGSPRALHALLPRDSRGWTLPQPAFTELVTKELSDPILLTLEILVDRPPSNADRLNFPQGRGEFLLPIPQTYGAVTAAEYGQRRRALETIRRFDVGGDRLAGMVPVLCALGAKPLARDLRVGAHNFLAPRIFVEQCLGAAAGAGEAEVVVQLLASAVKDGHDLMFALFDVLYCAIKYDRLNVLEAVLDYLASVRLSRDDAEYIARDVGLKYGEIPKRSTVYQYLQRHLDDVTF
ncbi:hypothetical protein HK405_003360 [Cladochytrium tenue]|nr:hypothetical protein HK405_003360 [Cladochytrium tenue]